MVRGQASTHNNSNLSSGRSGSGDQSVHQLARNRITDLYTTFQQSHQNSDSFSSSENFLSTFWDELHRTQGANFLSDISHAREGGVSWRDVSQRGLPINDATASVLEQRMLALSSGTMLIDRYKHAADAKIQQILKNPRYGFGSVALADYEHTVSQPLHNGRLPRLVDYTHTLQEYIASHTTIFTKEQKDLLSNLVVSNADMLATMFALGDVSEEEKAIMLEEEFDKWSPFSQKLFNQLSVLQKFYELSDAKIFVASSLDVLSDTFKNFPPYVHLLLKKYPFDESALEEVDPQYPDAKRIITQKLQESSNPSEKKLLFNDLRRVQRKAYIKYLDQHDSNLAHCIQILLDKNFVFSDLSVQDKQSLVDALVSLGISDALHNNIPHMLGMNPEVYSNLMTNFFSLTTHDIHVPTRHGDIPLHFAQKDLANLAWSEIPDINQISDFSRIPMQFIIDVDHRNERYLHQSVPSLFQNFQARNGNTLVHEGYKVKLTHRDGTHYEGYLSSKSPFHADIDARQSSDPTNLFLYTHPVNTPQTNREVNPLVISPNHEKDYDLEVLDKQLIVNGDAVGSLLYSVILSQTSMDHPDLPDTAMRKLLEATTPTDTYVDTNDLHQSQASGNEQQESGDTYAEVQKHFEHIFDAENLSLEVGTNFYLDLGTSNLPPKGSRVRGQATVKNIDKTKGTIDLMLQGTEISLGDYEGYAWQIPYSINGLETLKDGFDSVVVMPPVYNDLVKDRNMLALHGKKFGVETDTDFFHDNPSWTGSHFERDGKKISYFGLIPDGEDQPILYHIVPQNGKITVDCVYDESDKRYSHSYTVDYPSFCLLVASKGLQAYTDEQAKASQQAYNNTHSPSAKGSGVGVSFFSWNQIVGGFKNIVDGFKQKRDTWNKDKSDEFLDKLVMDYGLYKKLGRLLPSWLGGREFGFMQDEHILARDGKIFGKIEEIKKGFEGDPDVGRVVSERVVPLLQAGQKAKDPLEAAASLLYAIERGGGMYYRGLYKYAGQGKRVLALLGSDHQQSYLRKRDALLEKLRTKGDRSDSWFRNQLLELEMRYIVDAIRGGPHEGRDKEDLQKTFSIKFANTLEGAFNESQSPEKVSGKFKEMVDKGSFDGCVQEFMGHIKAGRTKDAIGNLKAMAQLYENSRQFQELHMCFLLGMLLGVFQYDTKEHHRDMLAALARTTGLHMGLWVESNDMQEKIAAVLDAITGSGFSRETKYRPSDYSSRGNQVNFIDSFKNRWNKGNGSVVTDFIGGKSIYGDSKNTLFYLAAHPHEAVTIQEKPLSTYEKSVITELAKFRISPDLKAVDRDIFNPNIYKQDLPASVIRETMLNIQNGSFTGEDTDKKKAALFWQAYLGRKPVHPQWDTIGFFTIFSRVYGGSNLNYVVKTLAMVNKLKRSGSENDVADAKDLLRYLIQGEISMHFRGLPYEVKKKVQQYEDFFYNNISEIASLDVLSQVPLFGQEVKGWLEDAAEDKYYPPLQYQRILASKKKNDPDKAEIQNNRHQFTINETLKNKLNQMNRFIDTTSTSVKLSQNVRDELLHTLSPGGVAINPRSLQDPAMKNFLQSQSTLSGAGGSETYEEPLDRFNPADMYY